MAEIHEDECVLPNPKELDTLLTILQNNNVYSFKLGKLEVVLNARHVVNSESLGSLSEQSQQQQQTYGIWSIDQ